MVRISVITVVFENVRFIREAIESVLSQTYPHIEYIVIDGGSKDGSMDIINAYSSRIHHLVSEPDRGIYDALNKGIQAATGDVIGILHSDDFYTDHTIIATIADTFAKTNVDAVYGDLDYVSLENKDTVLRKWRSGIYNEGAFLSGWMPPHPTFFVKKSVLQHYGGYNVALKSSSDYELLIRLIHKHHISIHYLPQVLVKMRVGGHSNRSLSNRVKAHLEDYRAWKIAGSNPRFYTLFFKLLRKLPQYKWLNSR